MPTWAVYRDAMTSGSFSTWWLKETVGVPASVMNRPDDEREAAPRWMAEHKAVARDEVAHAATLA